MIPEPALRPRSRDGFSLLELLVVIAILGILISILVPGFGRLKESMSIHRCVTNLGKQTQLVFDITTQRGGAKLPRDYWYGWQLTGVGGGSDGDGFDVHELWAELILPSLGTPSPPIPAALDNGGGGRDKYLAALFQERDIFQCHNMPPTSRNAVSVTHPQTGESVRIEQQPLDYAVNAINPFNPGQSGHSSSLSAIRKPSEVLYLTEAFQNARIDWFGQHDVFHPNHTWWGRAPRMATDDRHQGRLACSFSDGHAEIRRYEDIRAENFGLQ